VSRLAQYAAELVALESVAGARITAEALCGGHKKQLRAVLDTARWIILLCSRRAGKTKSIAFRFLLRSLNRPGSICVYIALTKPQARNVAMWEPIWKPLLEQCGLRKGIDYKNDETEMITTFANGSVCRFTGASDVRVIETELGGQLDEVVIDEAQSSPASVLGPLVSRILTNSLTDRRGTIVLAGTIPETDGGVFMDRWKNSNWSKHNWSQMENPHMADPYGELMEYLAANPGLTIDSPIIQRERFGRFVYDPNATAYTYSSELNGYNPVLLPWADEVMRDGIKMPPNDAFPNGRIFIPSGLMMAAAPEPWVEWISIAVDEAARRDRVAVQAIGWGKRSHRIQHLFDWTSEPGKKYTQGEIYAVAGLVRQRYGVNGRGVLPMKRDAGSSPNAIDTLMRDFGIPIIIAAKKGDRKAGVERCNTTLVDGRDMIMRGSCLEEDLQKSKWDKDARERGAWEWDRSWHPDAGDSWRYAKEHYFDAFEPAKPAKTLEQLDADHTAALYAPKIDYGIPGSGDYGAGGGGYGPE
jgi:hypothetical protein